MCKMYVCVCVAPPAESFLIVFVSMRACVPVRLASLTGRATHTHISKRTFDVAELYLAASSAGDFSRVTISNGRKPQYLSIFGPLYIGHDPVVQFSDSQPQ